MERLSGVEGISVIESIDRNRIGRIHVCVLFFRESGAALGVGSLFDFATVVECVCDMDRPFDRNEVGKAFLNPCHE